MESRRGNWNSFWLIRKILLLLPIVVLVNCSEDGNDTSESADEPTQNTDTNQVSDPLNAQGRDPWVGLITQGKYDAPTTLHYYTAAVCPCCALMAVDEAICRDPNFEDAVNNLKTRCTRGRNTSGPSTCGVNQRIKERFIDTGRIDLVLHDLPLVPPKGVAVSIAVRCKHRAFAISTFKGLQLTAHLWSNKENWEEEMLSEIGLSKERFDHCANSVKLMDYLKKEFEDTKALGIYGAPTFMIDGERLSGGSTEAIISFIEENAQ